MASLTATPAAGTAESVGEKIVITGEGFEPATVTTLIIPELGIECQLTSDAGGYISTDKYAAKAGGKLTVANDTSPTAAQNCVLGAVTYVFRAAVTTTANEILIGATGEETLANLKAAINLDTSLGAVYGSLTVIHPTVHAGELTATTLIAQAKTGGTGGNSLASTATATDWTWGDTTLKSGAAAGAANWLTIRPTTDKPFTVLASDGTNEATLTVSNVFTV